MDELMIRLLQGKATTAEREEIRAWRLASAANEQRYQVLSRIWTLSGQAEPTTTSRPAPATRDLVRKATPPAADPIPLHPRTRQRRLSPWAVRGAAAAALVALGFGLGTFRPSSDRTGPALGAAEVVTGESELATVRLGDGTIVRLASQSRLRVMDDANDREVWLDGRAFFAVAERDGEPFRVRSRAGDALVLGTRFELRVKENQLRVAVLEGRVALSAGTEQVEVRAGEVSHTAGGKARPVIEAADLASMLEWMGPFLVFQSTPLEQVARELEQHYGIRVRLLDERVAQRTVTAWFTTESIDDVLVTICRVADVHCSIRDGVATIEP